MASLKYGCLSPTAPKTTEYPVAASQYFYHNGINVVYLDGSGNVTLALTATATVLGIAVVPKGRGAGASDDYWLSSATAGADKIPVIDALDGYEFLLPADDTVTAAMRGNACDLIAANDGTATKVDVGTSSTDIFHIIDLGTNRKGSDAVATDVVVKFNIAKRQADT